LNKIIRYLTLAALLGSVAWLTHSPDWEPAVAFFTTLIAFLVLDAREISSALDKTLVDIPPPVRTKDEQTYARQRAVYDGLKAVLAKINSEGDAENEDIYELHRLMDESHFLFKDEIIDFIREWIKNAATLQLMNKKISSSRTKADELEKASAKSLEMLHFFNDQYDSIINIFKPYLHVEL